MKTKRDSRRIYILPTRFGLLFITGAVLMILIGSAYSNNLVNMLAFFMLSMVFVAMIQTHNNLRDIRVGLIETQGGFAGDVFVVTTVLENPSRATRFSFESRIKQARPTSTYENTQPLGPGGTLKLRAAYAATRRGRHSIRNARVASVYPLGLFEAWTWFDVNAETFVYPSRKGDRPLPRNESGNISGVFSRSRGGDDFHGHRKFQEGDSQRHIDWKAYARGRPKLIKEFDEGAPGVAVFDFNSLRGLDTEDRLSQLSLWVDSAKDLKIVFSLRLPNESIPPGQGLRHAVRCWEALAEFQDQSGAREAS